MKQKLKQALKAIVLTSVLGSSGVYALPNNTTVDIQIAGNFKNKNILFLIENTQQEVGIHYAGGLMMSHKVVNIVDENPQYIDAYVTDPLTGETVLYSSKDSVQLNTKSHIGLSFPELFWVK